MKTTPIKFNGAIGTCSSRVDRSMRIPIATPDLSVIEKATIMDLQGINVDVIITPLDINPSTPIMEVNKDINSKSQSQRLRSVLYVLWEQQGKPDIFDIVYHKEMDKIIEHYKNKLE